MSLNLKLEGLHAANEEGKLNQEWVVLGNSGDKPFNAEGCSVTVARGGGRPRVVATIGAGVVVHPNERVRLISGSSGKKSHGDPPAEEGIRNVHLYLKGPYLERNGLTVRIVRGQLELARANFE